MLTIILALSMSEEYQIVVRDGKPYIRRKPYTYENPTLRQEVHRGRVAKVAYDLYDKAKGYKDGLPIVAAKVKEELKGKKLPAPPPKTLELTPYQYVDLLMRIEERQLKGEKTVLGEILRESNLRIKIVMPPEIKVPAE